MNNITGYSAQNNIAGLRQSADIIDETNEASGIVYFGFCKPGTTGTNSETWSICKLTQVAGVSTFLWAQGSANFNLIFDNRADYDYIYANFRVVNHG